nr:putative immunoglobulin lambda light chain [Taeniopygia guttata]
MAWAPLLFVVLAHSTGSLVQAALTQQPSSLSAKVGDTVRITCSGSSHYGWYQQKVPGSGPVTVIYDSNKRPSDIPSRFSGSKSGSTGTLTITGVRAEDEAVYFCASWDSSSGGYGVFGAGTTLTVTGQPQVAPTVHLFAPSSEELSQGKATVVCLIENFYPRDVTVEWVADGKTITSGVETSQSQQQSNAQQQSSTRYLASSYLSLTPTEWQGYNSVSCKVRHVAGNVEKTLNTSECA